MVCKFLNMKWAIGIAVLLTWLVADGDHRVTA
jgi:hypothetical protein